MPAVPHKCALHTWVPQRVAPSLGVGSVTKKYVPARTCGVCRGAIAVARGGRSLAGCCGRRRGRGVASASQHAVLFGVVLLFVVIYGTAGWGAAEVH